MKLLITGGAGFIGSSIADRYLAAGHEVGVVDDLSTGRIENLPGGVSFFQANIADHDRLEGIFAEFRPEVVSHHAAQMDIRRSLREPLFDAHVNVLGSLSVLELCARYGVKKFIFASSGGATYGEPEVSVVNELTPQYPISHYGVTKLCVERYLHVYHRLYGLEFVSLRYANVYGPRQNPHGEAGVVAIFSGQVLRGEPATIFGDGSKTRDYVFVDDVVDANGLALDFQGCGVFNIGCGIHVSDFEMFEAVRKSAGSAQRPLFAAKRAGEIEHIALDAGAAARSLGWKPKTSLAEGVARTVAHIQGELDLKNAVRPVAKPELALQRGAS